MRSRTSVQTEDDQLIAGQSARVSGHLGLWFGAQWLCSPNWFEGISDFQVPETPEIHGSEIQAVIWGCFISSSSHFTQWKSPPLILIPSYSLLFPSLKS